MTLELDDKQKKFVHLMMENPIFYLPTDGRILGSPEAAILLAWLKRKGVDSTEWITISDWRIDQCLGLTEKQLQKAVNLLKKLKILQTQTREDGQDIRINQEAYVAFIQENI